LEEIGAAIRELVETATRLESAVEQLAE